MECFHGNLGVFQQSILVLKLIIESIFARVFILISVEQPVGGGSVWRILLLLGSGTSLLAQ